MKEMVSIITVNYNGWRDTCELIESFKQHETYPDYEFIIVDNASHGDDVEQLRNAYPDLKIIACDRNLGFAGGNNTGIRHASGEYLFFLNNDTLIKAPVLQMLVDCFCDKSVGGVSPLIRYSYLPNDVQYSGWEKLTPVTLKNPITGHSQYATRREIGVMHGAAMMIPRHIIQEIGLMPECYFLYYEEYDWSYNILDHKLRILYEPAAVVFHKEGTKQGLQMTPFRAYYMTRARVLFARRHTHGIGKALSCLYLTAVAMPFQILRKIKAGQWKSARAILSGTISGLTSSKNKALTQSS